MISLPILKILEWRDALAAGTALADAKHEANMKSGKYDEANHLAAMAAKDAEIIFKVYVLDKLPSVTMEIAT